jgi:transposase-like protein
MTETHDIILKSDRRGRLRFSPEQRAAMLGAYDASGLSGPKFAQLHGINYQTFAGWVQRRKCAVAPAVPATAAVGTSIFTLLEATTHIQSDSRLEVQLPGGVRLLIENRSHLALAVALMRELQLPQSC